MKNPEAEYNTSTGEEGYVLDKNGNTTDDYTLYTKANYCNYDETTGETTLKDDSVKLCTVTGAVTGPRERLFRSMCTSGWRDVMRTVPRISAIRPCKNWQFPLQVSKNKENSKRKATERGNESCRQMCRS